MTEKIIVLVEPDDVLRGYTNDILRALGHKVISFQMALEAVDWGDWNSCMLLITSDWSPHYSGVQLVELIRGRGCDFPIIMLTSMHSFCDHSFLTNKGVNQILPKPFQREEFLQVAREMILV